MKKTIKINSIEKIVKKDGNNISGVSPITGEKWYLMNINNEFPVPTFVLEKEDVVVGSEVVIDWIEEKNGKYVKKIVNSIKLVDKKSDLENRIKRLEDEVFGKGESAPDEDEQGGHIEDNLPDGELPF